MKKLNRKLFCCAVLMLAAFAAWTVMIRCADVRQIGPMGSSVGLAAVNRFVHGLTGVHMTLYTVTDWLGLVPVAFALGFAVLGLVQWIRRRSLMKVDFSIITLGGLYIAVVLAYLFFEEFVVNYRPVLIEGRLEASYPSSTTLLVLCVMPSCIMQFNKRIKRIAFRRMSTCAIAAFSVFMVVARLISGVHWFTDIIGGILLSAGLVMMYGSVSGY